MKRQAKVVFIGTNEWFHLVAEEIETTEEWNDAAVAECGINTEDPESWCERVTRVDPRHSAIRRGDYVVSQGVGDDVVFVRLQRRRATPERSGA